MTKVKPPPRPAPEAKRAGRSWGPLQWGLVGAAVLVLVGVIAFSVGAAGNPSPQETGAGTPAPDIALPTFAGNTVAIADFRGQPLVVNYFASWCAPCIEEMPGFERVYQAHKGDVAFLGINLTDDATYGQAVVEYTGITYPVVRDEDGSSFVAFGGYGMPTTVFISPDGEVLEVYSGLMIEEWLEDRVSMYFEA